MTDRAHTVKDVCERYSVGESDADRLASIGLVGTTNACGANSWLDEYSETLRGRRVVLLPDNDPAGWDRVRKIARELKGIAASVKIVELPGLPEKGDVSDWLDAGGSKKELLSLVNRTQPNDPPNDPTDQQDNSSGEVSGTDPTGQQVTQQDEVLSCCVLGTVVRYPVEALPKALQKFIESIAKALPCPPDFAGAMMLAVLSACIGRKRCIEVKGSWREYPLLWVAVVARSGDRKTPAFQEVTAPLRQLQSDLLAKYHDEKKQWEELPAEERQQSEHPQLQQILTTDTTIEALKDVLASNPNGTIYAADELSGWVRSMSQYKQGRGDDRQHWLSIWSGTQIVCNRKTAEPIIINGPFVSVTGGIQPDALGDLIEDGREDGFAARLLFAYPDAIPNKDWSEDTIQGAEAYAGICKTLWNLKPSTKPLTFDPKAKDIWVEWVNSHRQESPPDNLRAFWSKLEGYCARLALVLFLTSKACNETKATQIDERSIRGAVSLINYFKSHARRVYAAQAVQSDTGRIGKALKWVKKHGGRVTARLAQMNSLCKDSNEAKDLFYDLEELGHGTVTEKPRGSVEFQLRDITTQRPTRQQDDG